MFGWLKAKAQKKIADTMRDDLLRFLESLKGAASQELGMMLVVATTIRLNLLERGVISESALDVGLYSNGIDDDTAGLRLNKLIRTFQKEGQLSDAAGAMIWLHSVRCIQTPELRNLGRQLWAELERGMPLVEFCADDLELMGARLPGRVRLEAKFIPKGLEPVVA